MITTAYGYQVPVAGDKSRGTNGWMPGYEYNVARFSAHSHNGIDSVNLSALGEIDFAMANNQVAAANVTNVSVSSAQFLSCVVKFSVSRVSGSPTELRAMGTFKLVYYAGTATWTLIDYQEAGDATGVVFTVTPAGQVQYTSTNVAGGANVDKAAFQIEGLTYA